MHILLRPAHGVQNSNGYELAHPHACQTRGTFATCSIRRAHTYRARTAMSSMGASSHNAGMAAASMATAVAPAAMEGCAGNAVDAMPDSMTILQKHTANVLEQRRLRRRKHWRSVRIQVPCPTPEATVQGPCVFSPGSVAAGSRWVPGRRVSGCARQLVGQPRCALVRSTVAWGWSLLVASGRARRVRPCLSDFIHVASVLSGREP